MSVQGNMRAYSNIVSFVLLLFLISLEFCICSYRNSSTSGSIMQEQQALQRLRASFTDPCSLLDSWEGNDYCQWQGVGCDAITGHVVGLDLTFSSLFDIYDRDGPLCDPYYLEANDVSPSLVELKHLNYLDLSGNHFHGSPIPVFLGSMKQLRHLNLSNSEFKGKIPLHLGNLSNLQFLDISDNSLYGTIPLSFRNLLALRELDLSRNHLNGTITTFINELSALMELRLSDNQLYGSIPSDIGRLSSLHELDLSKNHLDGSIPESLGQLVNLSILRVADNSLTGIVSEIHLGNLSNLSDLQLGFNNLVVEIESNWIPPFKHLHDLGIASCNIGPHFPSWLQTLEQLTALDLSSNSIEGKITRDFGYQNPKLEKLILKNNLLVGSIPSFLCDMLSLFILDLSENSISGEIPNCWGGNDGMLILNLGSNQLSGTIPSSFGNILISWLNLSNNSLLGEPFQALKNIEILEILDLGENQFSGKIPYWVGENFTLLQTLRLRQNWFSGDIPTSLCYLFSLRILDLADNNFSGSIPPCIGHLNGMVKHATPTNTIAKITILALNPSWSLAGDTRYDMPRLREVGDQEQWEKEGLKQVLKGLEQDYTTNLKYLANMDLSNNSLIGPIPASLTSLSGMIGLNLSYNRLSGKIPSNIQEMESLESIDFSNNHLCGPIPSKMSTMDSLGHLNLSYNNFSGPIPRDNHFLTFDDPSIYVGNPYLYGEPLKNKRPGADEVQPQPTSGTGNDDEKEKVLFYFVVTLGFITGFWAFIGTLLLKRNWRQAYFGYVEKVADKMYVAIKFWVARLKRVTSRE